MAFCIPRVLADGVLIVRCVIALEYHHSRMMQRSATLTKNVLSRTGMLEFFFQFVERFFSGSVKQNALKIFENCANVQECSEKPCCAGVRTQERACR
jgi:hypothetical protein